MPVAIKRQKASAKPRAAPTKQNASASIASFARVSKDLGSSDMKDITSTSTTFTSTPAQDAKLAAVARSSRKRKAIATIEDDSSGEETPTKSHLPSSTTSTPIASTRPVKRTRGRPSKKARPAPRPLKRARSSSVSDSDQSTVNTDKLFKRLRLESSPLRSSSPLTADSSIADSEAESNIHLNSAPTLPREVLDLISLHTSLLKTLTLHYAHNGFNVPADLRIVCPNIARAWGKKNVTEADVRTCIGILNRNNSNILFTLANYGRGKICIEIDSSHGSGPLNEKKLNDLFRTNLEAMWSNFAVNGKPDATKFVSSLPKAPITVCDSLAKATPMMAKGQKRLEELKQGFAAKRLEKETKPATATASSMTNPDGSKMSLLDRIRQKQLQKCALPAGLSPAQLERRAALQRVTEVSAMIGMLSRASSGGQGRISFTMAVMLEKLKDSFRMGISREEGAVCVRLLGSEVAPEWIRVVTIGQRENVVIETDRQLSKANIESRVKAVIAKEQN